MEHVTDPLYGNYRAKVIDNKDKEFFGRVMVYIPDLMQLLSSQDQNGLWARPANNPLGGRNTLEGTDENHYMGTCYIPRKGAWVWIFFEAGNINRPYYFGALDIEHAKVLPENQLGPRYQDKWTIFKSNEGRTIVISDDDFDQRVEITGTKRDMLTTKEIPSGDTDSVYQIDGNMTTILFDEREGKQKILIRTYLGDFLHVDIDERKLQAEFESDIIIKTNASFYLTAKKDIHIRSEEENINLFAEEKDINIRAKKNVNIYANEEDINIRAEVKNIKLAALEDTHITSVVGDIYIDATSSDVNILSGNNMFNTAGGSFNVAIGTDHVVESATQMSRRAGTTHDTDAGTNVNVQSGTSKTAQTGTNAEIAIEAIEAEPAEPKGERDT
jgi:hypothetical protein